MQFIASYRGRTSWIGHASSKETAALVRPHAGGHPRGHLDDWSLISFRSAGFPEPRIHALGLLRSTGCLRTTSRVLSLGEVPASIVTRSGSRYDLGRSGNGELAREARTYLRQMLLYWGFEDLTDDWQGHA